MIKKSFIESLVGMTLNHAEVICHQNSLATQSLPENAIIIAIAFPNTILLYHNANGKVVHAHAGDPLQVENDL